jgi:hypothetical protein
MRDIITTLTGREITLDPRERDIHKLVEALWDEFIEQVKSKRGQCKTEEEAETVARLLMIKMVSFSEELQKLLSAMKPLYKGVDTDEAFITHASSSIISIVKNEIDGRILDLQLALKGTSIEEIKRRFPEDPTNARLQDAIERTKAIGERKDYERASLMHDVIGACQDLHIEANQRLSRGIDYVSAGLIEYDPVMVGLAFTNPSPFASQERDMFEKGMAILALLETEPITSLKDAVVSIVTEIEEYRKVELASLDRGA